MRHPVHALNSLVCIALSLLLHQGRNCKRFLCQVGYIGQILPCPFVRVETYFTAKYYLASSSLKPSVKIISLMSRR